MHKCDSVLAQQISESNSSLTTKIAFLDTIDASEWEDLNRKASGKAVFKAVPIGINYDEMKEWLRNFKRTVGYNHDSSASTHILHRSLDPDQIKAWAGCMADEKPEGLVLSFQPPLGPRDSKDTQLNVNWNPPVGVNPITIALQLKGGKFRNKKDASFKFPASISSRSVGIDRLPKEEFLKVDVNATYDTTGATEGRSVGYIWELPRLVTRTFSITDEQPYTYLFTFLAMKDNDGRIRVVEHEPSGGLYYIDSYLSPGQPQILKRIPPGALTYSVGKLSLDRDPATGDDCVYFEGTLHAALNGKEESVQRTLIAILP